MSKKLLSALIFPKITPFLFLLFNSKLHSWTLLKPFLLSKELIEGIRSIIEFFHSYFQHAVIIVFQTSLSSIYQHLEQFDPKGHVLDEFSVWRVSWITMRNLVKWTNFKLLFQVHINLLTKRKNSLKNLFSLLIFLMMKKMILDTKVTRFYKSSSSRTHFFSIISYNIFYKDFKKTKNEFWIKFLTKKKTSFSLKKINRNHLKML